MHRRAGVVVGDDYHLVIFKEYLGRQLAVYDAFKDGWHRTIIADGVKSGNSNQLFSVFPLPISGVFRNLVY
jgi:hypothetical protein